MNDQDSVVQSAVLEYLQTKMSADQLAGFRRGLDRIGSSATFDYLRQSFAESCQQPEMLSPAVLEELFDEYLEDWGYESIGATAEEVAAQKSIAIHLWQTTVNRRLFGDLFFLFNAGYMIILQKFTYSLKTGDDRLFIRELQPRMLKLIDAEETEKQNILHRMAMFRVPGQPYEESTLLTRMMAAISTEIAGFFMKIKYFEILRKGQEARNN